MSSMILCEGADDAFVLGAYFQKKLGFKRDNNAKFSSKFNIPKNELNLSTNIYVKNSFSVAIMNVKGQDRFPKAKNHLMTAQGFLSQETISEVFLMMDRDSDTEQEKLDKIFDLFLTFYPDNKENPPLINMKSRTFTYRLRSNDCPVECFPMVIPFDREGALETILMEVIRTSGDEGQYIVEQANGYVDDLLKSTQLSQYLRKEREQLKARFSSTLSITNPDHAISTYTSLLDSCDWELSPFILKNFKVFDDFFD